MAGIYEVMIISSPEDIGAYQRLLGDGSPLGINLQYKVQKQPKGLAEAFILGADFIKKDPVCLILGDNIFYGIDFSKQLENIVKRTKSKKTATIFGYTVKDPHRYGVIEFDNNSNALSIEEKPIQPRSNQAVVGLYFYPNSVIRLAKSIEPSQRGELEITSINNYFIKKGILNLEHLGQGFTWLDTGTHESLLEASQFIETIEKRQGIKVACLEEIAFKKGLISKKELLDIAKQMRYSSYGQYLIKRYSR
tara:strand:- start:174 stop:923 length:750 start_codon:yes stop_codon:yes gene_type:complete